MALRNVAAVHPSEAEISGPHTDRPQQIPGGGGLFVLTAPRAAAIPGHAGLGRAAGILYNFDPVQKSVLALMGRPVSMSLFAFSAPPSQGPSRTGPALRSAPTAF